MFIGRFERWCKDRKPDNITRIWFGENLSGSMTNIQIYSRLLSNKEMEEITTCKLFIPGDYLSWQTTQWRTNPLGVNATTTITRINMTSVEYSDICKSRKSWKLVFSHSTRDNSFQMVKVHYTPAQWNHNIKWCAMLKAKQIVLPSHDDRKRFKEFLDKTFSKSNATKMLCISENDGVWEGRFNVAHRKAPGPYIYRNEYTGELLNVTEDDWNIPPSPNSRDLNIFNAFWLAMEYSNLKYTDRTIGDGSCQACVGNQNLIPWVRIRGLCKKSVFDKRYMIGDDYYQGIFFQGERGTNITKKWTPNNGVAPEFAMIHTQLERDKPNITIKVNRAWTESPYGTFLLGKRKLKVEEDEGCEPTKTNYTLDVVFSTCLDDEFTCDDGFCINMTKRCDNIQNCPTDVSDEVECKLLTVPSSYRKAYAPTKVGEKDKVIKVNVTVSMDVTNILRLSETQDIFETKLKLHLSWFDNRLTFNNLKLGKKNTMEKDDQYKIWIPPAFFENTKDSDEIVNDHRSSAYVTRNGSFELVDMNMVYNTEMFRGDENFITLSRIYRQEFICIYQIAWYPFDTQRCRIVLSLLGNSGEFVNLITGKLAYLGPEDLTIYFIKQTTIERMMSNDDVSVYVEVTLGRRLLSTVLTVYLPTMLLNVIGFSTNFFKVTTSSCSSNFFSPYFRISSLKQL